MKETIFIENLKCGGCGSTILKNLKGLPGVQDVAIDFTDYHVDIVREAPATRAQIVATLTKLGYPERGNNDMISKAKSYVSCAIGRLSD